MKCEKRSLRIVVVLLACIFLSATAFAQQKAKPAKPTTTAKATPASDIAAQMDSLLAAKYAGDGPGAAAIVVKDGKTILRKGYGMADIEMNVPVLPQMVFRIGSVTKQFTSAVIMMLVEEGKLSTSDEITKFLPDYPTQGRKITIEHLLTHTSGIVPYTGMPKWVPLLRKDMSVSEMIDVFKNEPMEFAPGEKWNYNNSGYFLLGAIIEKVTGKKYADVVNERIFVPAGMKHSYYGDTTPIIPGRAHGYERDKGRVVNASYISMTQPYAAGSLLSSVDDLALWDAALSSGKLLKQSSLDRVFTDYKLANGKKTGYGYGWILSTYEGHAVEEHGGGINGFLCHVLRIPDEHVYVAVLTNDSSAQGAPNGIARKIAAIAIGRPIVEPKALSFTPSVLDEYAGYYETAEKSAIEVTRVGDLLVITLPSTQRVDLRPSSATEFFSKDDAFLKVVFERDSAGKVVRLRTDNWGSGAVATRTAKPASKIPVEVKVDPAKYDALAGEYELAPGFILTVTRVGDKLMTQATGQGAVQIFPTSETEFFLKVIDARISFVKDADGKVTSLVLHQGGRDLPARRIK